jgi:glycosyltransferase involved in cell wall biosynthesis
MKVAIVHDYIKEYGGAERVLETLAEIYPDAPIYTAFSDKNSTAYKHFKNRTIVNSWFQNLPFCSKFASPLRFLTPLIWGSFDFSKYDLILSSASWYITKGFGGKLGKKPIEICYCHTPPRWLYGYTTSVNLKKYWPVKIYALIVGHFLRLYDYNRAQKVDYFIANSKEVQTRIKKFYRRDSTIVYPPISLSLTNSKSQILNPKAKDYYLIVSRIVGAKGLELAVQAALRIGLKLKIAGSPAGYSLELDKLIKQANGKVEFLGQVSDEELIKLYMGAKAFLALAKDEDFGITPVESQALGTPVIAFNGGGYKESVISQKTGILFDEYSVDGLINAIKIFESIKINPNDCIAQAQKFSKERFEKEIKEVVAFALKS